MFNRFYKVKECSFLKYNKLYSDNVNIVVYTNGGVFIRRPTSTSVFKGIWMFGKITKTAISFEVEMPGVCWLSTFFNGENEFLKLCYADNMCLFTVENKQWSLE